MDRRVALLSALLALALIVPFSVVAVASPSAQPGAAPPGAPADQPSITATGTGITPASGGDLFFAPQTLFIAAQSKSAVADVDAAAAEMQTRMLAIKAGLEKVGIPSTAIHFQGLSLQPQYGPPGPGAPSPVEKGQPPPQQIQSFMIAGNMQVDVAEPKLLGAAITSATANGATSVNSSFGKGGPSTTVQPSAAQLRQLGTDALKNASDVAEALAAAGGTKLGPLRSIVSQQIYPDCCAGTAWRMVLTVTFDIAP